MNIKELRLKLKKMALDLEMLDNDSENLLSVPDSITNSLTNLTKDVDGELKSLRKKEYKDYLNSR